MVTLDSMMQAPDKVTKECVVDFESKSLRGRLVVCFVYFINIRDLEVRDKIVAEGLSAGYSYAEKHSHPRYVFR